MYCENKAMTDNEHLTLELKDHQLEHFSRILDILEKHNYYMDFSRMGLGKTYTCSMAAQYLGLRLFVVCPVSAQAAWIEMKKYGVEIEFITSYQSLRGTDRYPPKHGYLNRSSVTKKDKKGNETKKVIFTPTDEFTQLVKEGILLVFDEGQSIKNSSDQGKASRALSAAIETPSKCAFISGSPYDKEEHSENILRFLSILKQKRLIWSNPLTGEKMMKGILDVINYCSALEEEQTKNIVTEFMDGSPYLSLSAAKARSLCHRLFTEIVKKHLYSEMMPEESEYSLHMEESYIYLRDKELQDLSDAISDLGQATRFNGKDVDTDKIEWGAVTLALQRVEMIMVEPMVKFALKILEDPSAKVILSVSFLDVVKELMDQLQAYNPLFIDGSVKAIERTKRVNVFNTNDKHRILISTIKTGGISISLHDRVGDHPRHYLLIPTYSIIDIYQASGRIHRTGLKSDAYFYMIYGTDPPVKDKNGGIKSEGHSIKITPILNALSRKKDVLKDLITKQSSVYKLPGEYVQQYYDI